jgi:DNA invertase Pin-like site-specific DNA recombinase
LQEDLPRKGLWQQSRAAQFQRMLDQTRVGDTIVVWKLDRLARSTRDLLETMDAIREAGARFMSLSEPWADTTTHAGKMIMTIFAGIAEFERDLIRERTGAGREAARKRGVRFGRPRKLQFRSGAVGSAACS